jgi:hypothetical protein
MPVVKGRAGSAAAGVEHVAFVGSVPHPWKVVEY